MEEDDEEGVKISLRQQKELYDDIPFKQVDRNNIAYVKNITGTVL